MGKGNMLLGQLRGSVGDVTFSVRDGSQISRVRVRVVKNPRSEAQQIQRMILATVSRAYSRLKSIVDHSFEGIAYGAKSQQYFLKHNMDRLRAYYKVDSSAADFPLTNAMAFVLPNDVADAGVGLVISKGSLREFTTASGDDGEFFGMAVTVTAPSGPVEEEGQGNTYTLSNVLNICGAQAGDQITVCGFVADDAGNIIFKKSRYVVRADVTTADLGAKWDPLGAASYFDAVKTVIDPEMTLVGGLQDGYVKPETNSFVSGVTAGTIIVSRKQGNKWLRNTAVLFNMSDELPGYQKDFALPLWMASGTDIETTDARYLNNADI